MYFLCKNKEVQGYTTKALAQMTAQAARASGYTLIFFFHPWMDRSHPAARTLAKLQVAACPNNLIALRDSCN